MVAALVVVTVLVRGTGRHEVDAQRVEATRASPAAAAAALATFVAAVAARDEVSLTGLAPSNDPSAEKVLAGVAANAKALDLTGVAARYVAQVGTVAPDGAWSAVAELSWQVAGDETPSRADVVVKFAPVGDGDVGIAGFGGSDTGRLPLWLRGELSVARAPGVLVMVDGPQGDAESVVDRVVRGIDVVRRVLPRWREPVVVEVPASASDLDETLGAAPGTYAGIAAVTAAAGSSSASDAPVHVFVNPEVTAGLRRAGAQVVMSHELVHVATDATRGGMEPWLVEGFADYVALRDTRLPDGTTLGRAIASSRVHGVPAGLPTAADFDTRGPELQARYEESWLACRIVAEQVGERSLVDAYHAVRAGVATRVALARAGLMLRELEALWRAHLKAQV